MAEIPPVTPEDQKFAGCPYCTIQIPADAKVCPYCQQVQDVPKAQARPRAPRKEPSFLSRSIPASQRDSLYRFWSDYGKWIKIGAPVLAAAVLLFIAYGAWVGYRVRVVRNPDLPVKVKHEKRGEAVWFRVSVTNEGQDVPDLSLRSVGVVTEFVYRDGRRDKKTMFPKTELRGEGALLHGETGRFEIEVPAAGLAEVVFRSEVVDLGTGRRLIPPGGRRRYVPPGR